jgi:ligand-binding sensor domain-containing protein
MKYINLYTFLLLLVFSTACKGQTKTDSVNKDTVSFYGPNTMVRNVKQGRNGTILFAATRAGVFRYNGKLFTNLTSKIGPRRYWNVLEDRRGSLWFATTDSGVYRYHGNSFQHFTTREGLVNNGVFTVYEDRAGNIWFGTGGGISRYDGKSFRNFTTKDGLPSNNINNMLEDRAGKLWIGTRDEACFYDGNTFTIFKNKDGKAFSNVWGITEDRKGNIWFGASVIEDKKGSTLFVSAGLWRYDGNSFIKVSQRSASAIIQDKKGNIWTTGAVNPNGVGAWILSRYDRKTLYDKNPTVTEIISMQKMLCGILEATDGSIWFGSIGGVYRYDGKTITDFRSKEGQQ